MQSVLEDSLIVLDTVPEGYFRLDSDFRFTFVNRAALPLLGKTREDLLGKKVLDVYPSCAGSPMDQGCRRAMAERVVVTTEHYFEPSQAWYSITAMPDSKGGICIKFSDISERKAMETALQRSEEKFCKAFRSSPTPMCIVDIDKNASFIEVNEAFERITGYRRDEVIGRTTTELGLYDDIHVLEESRRRLLEEGGYRNLEVRFRKKNGDILVGLISAEQIRIDSSLCAISVAVDITDRRLAEQALRESEDMYRRLFEVESDALFLVDRESGRILAANAAASAFYGYDRKELLSMTVVDLSAEPEKTLQATRATMPAFIPLRWHKKKDGVVFPVEISSCYFELKGRPAILSAIRDITSRRQMEEAVRESEEKFSRAFQLNPAAITIMDLASKSYLEVNEAFEKMTGYLRGDLIGHEWVEISIWADLQARDRAVAELIQEGRVRNCDFRFRKKNGDLGFGLFSAELIEIGGRQCAITAITDITGRVELEDQLRQAQKLESVGRLAGGVAHDFNNLLTIINGYSDFILETSAADDLLRPHVQEIRKAGERAAGLTRQLLAFSRKQVIEPKLVDVNSVVRDTERLLLRLIGEDIELETSLSRLAGQVMADPDQIHQVLMNLAVNARDAMPDGGKLKISTRNVEVNSRLAALHPGAVPGRYVRITFSDTGVGMDEATLQKAFEPFFTTKDQGKGTGLGLSMVYGIVRQSGGWIDVRSKPEQGTTFNIYLPRVEVRPVPVPEGLAANGTLHGGETVLVVEDHKEVRSLTKTILETYGYHVLEAGNGVEALALEKDYSDEIDLLLTDVILPGMNGKVLSERLRELRPDIKVLFTSGYAADVIARRGILERDVAYLAKPFSPESLAAKVREVLTQPATSPQAGGSSAS